MAMNHLLSGSMALAIGLLAESQIAAPGFDYSNMTALAAVVAVLLFIVTKLLPDWYQKQADLAKNFGANLLEQSKAFAASIDQSHARHIDDVKQIREEHRSQVAELVSELKATRDSGMEIVRKCGTKQPL